MFSFFYGKKEDEDIHLTSRTIMEGQWDNSDDDKLYQFTTSDGEIPFAMENRCYLTNPCQHHVIINGEPEKGLWGGLKIHQYLIDQGIPVPDHFDYLNERILKDDFINRIKKDDLKTVLKKGEELMSFKKIFAIALRNKAEKICQHFFEKGQTLDKADWIDLVKGISLENFKKLVETGLDPLAKKSSWSSNSTIINSLHNPEVFQYLLDEVGISLDQNYNEGTQFDAKYLIDYVYQNKANPKVIELILQRSSEKKVKYSIDITHQHIIKENWDILKQWLEDDLIDKPEILAQRILYKVRSRPYLEIAQFIKNKFPQFRNL